MKLLFIASLATLSLLPTLAATAQAGTKGDAFVCESREGADDWYVEGFLGAATVRVDQDELGVSEYKLVSETEENANYQRYVYASTNGQESHLVITNNVRRPELSRARLFAQDSKDVFDHVAFSCKFPRPVTF